MEERTARIIRSAVSLAEKGGFQAVRLRDVAAHSGVALGTLYTRFRSKEDILVAALEAETQHFETLMASQPIPGETSRDRVTHFFTLATRALFGRPNFSRAVLRSVASGVPEIAEKVLNFHTLMSRLITVAMRGDLLREGADQQPSESETQIAFLLQQIWFATLVGWMGGVQDEDTVVAHMRESAALLLANHTES